MKWNDATPSRPIDFDDRLGEGMRRLLRGTLWPTPFKICGAVFQISLLDDDGEYPAARSFSETGKPASRRAEFYTIRIENGRYVL